MVMILIGDKSDLEHRRAVIIEEGNAFASKHGVNSMDTRTKTTHDGEGAFLGTAEEIHRNIKSRVINVINESYRITARIRGD